MNKTLLDKLENDQDELRKLISQLSDDDRARIYSELKNELKDPDTYAALNFGLFAGLHHFYLGRVGRAISELLIFVLGIWIVVAGNLLGWILVAAVTLVEIYELFRAQVVVFQYNNDLIKEKLKQFL
ncbi:TM2 domain-containing protein [Pleionea sediminis]|uniref:TM2 domain-containing protein n=1 Tax=Pleionea sediminis TaxID=2569479 RepID=UPI001185B1E3|nr:TM2 domain-containing protein [Pleionea sediminis]